MSEVAVASAPMPRAGARVTWWVVAVVIGFVVAALWWGSRPSLDAALAEHDLLRADAVQLDDDTWIAVRPRGRGVEAFYADYDLARGWDAARSASVGDDTDDGMIAGMVGWGGDDSQGWSALLYGIGPPGTTDIAVVGSRAVGYVTDPSTGAFFIASREELGPADLRYFLLDRDSRVLLEGLGLAARDLQ